MLDRTNGRLVFMASAAGGMEIEEVAAKDPNAIIKEHIVPGFGLQDFQAREIAFRLGLDAKYTSGAVKFMMALVRVAEDLTRRWSRSIPSSLLPMDACSHSTPR